MIEKANAGDAERQYKLSLRYEKEPAVAREWLEKAAAGLSVFCAKLLN